MPTMERGKKPKVLVVCGPTAVGKSDIAVQLAKRFKGEVVSADSRQVYKGLHTVSGKICTREMRGVRHWLLDVANPKRKFSVTQYVTLAKRAIANILSRGKLPIVCGGTGFYIQALVEGIVLPDVQPNAKLRAKLAKKSARELLKMLRKLDPRRAKEIDKNNKRRVIRAIEIAKALGKVPRVIAEAPYRALYIGITLPKEELHKRITVRLFARMKAGMVREVKRLHRQGISWKRMEELGLEYRYLARYLQGKLTRAETIRQLNTEIWHYAKRQMTWFKRNKKVHCFSISRIRSVKKEVGG